LSILKAKNENLADSMANFFSELLFTSVANLKDTDPDSLIKICATLNITVGGIYAATETRFNWNPKALSLITGPVAVADMLLATDVDYIEKIWQRLISACTFGNDKPDLIICSQGIWDVYEACLRDQKRFNDNFRVADGGFDALLYRGVEIIVDPHVPGGSMNQVANDCGTILCLNTKYLHYRHLLDFDTSEWKKAEKQHIMFAGMDWMGALTCSRRDRQGSMLLMPTDYQILGSY